MKIRPYGEFPGQLERITVIMEVGGESRGQVDDDLNIWDIRDGEYKWRYKLGRSSELVTQRDRSLVLTYRSQMIILSSNQWLNLSAVSFAALIPDLTLWEREDRCEDLNIWSHDGSGRPSCFGTLWMLSSIILCKIFVLNYSDFDYRPDWTQITRENKSQPWGEDRWPAGCVKIIFRSDFDFYHSQSARQEQLSPYLCRISEVSQKKWNQMVKLRVWEDKNGKYLHKSRWWPTRSGLH